MVRISEDVAIFSESSSTDHELKYLSLGAGARGKSGIGDLKSGKSNRQI
jgi:hypothetical protein